MAGMTGFDVSVCLKSESRKMLTLMRAGIVISSVMLRVQAGILLVSFMVVECGVSYSDVKHLYQRLLSAIAHFLSLRNKDLVFVCNEIPLSMLSRSRERLNQRQCSQDYPLSCTFHYIE